LLYHPQSGVQFSKLFREPGFRLLIVAHGLGPLVWL
jgi:hypothetical protein